MTRRTLVSAIATTIAVGGVLWSSVRNVETQGTPSSYTVFDIGTLGGATTMAHGTDEELIPVVGSATIPDGRTRAFIRDWLHGITPLPTLGGNNGEAYATAGGTTVGRSQLSSTKYHATVWDSGRTKDLGTLGGAESAAYGTNGGVVVGTAETSTAGATQAFSYDWLGNQVMTPLNVDFGGTRSIAYDVNTAGAIVGTASLANNTVSHAFLYENGGAKDLGSPEGTSVALALNELNHVVGYWSADGKTTRAFFYDTSLKTLPGLGGTFTRANALNRSDVIVGEAETVGGVRHAVIWREGAITDLNTLIPSGSGWVLQSAVDIDSVGQIVGYGTKGGQVRSFLLLPPGDLTLRIDNVAEESTNFPNPQEAGSTIYYGATVSTTSPYWVTGIVITHTFSGPVTIKSWFSSGSRFTCTSSGQTLTCRAPWIDPGFSDNWVLIRAESTGAGILTHSATVRADEPDPNLANNSASQTNRAFSLADLTVATPVVGGNSAAGHVTLTSPVGGGGTAVHLASSNTAVATVPSPFTVEPNAYGGVGRDFWVTTKPVTAPTDVQISATNGLVTVTRTLRIIPFAPTPFGTLLSLPNQIEAENYDAGGEGIAYHDTTAGNTGGDYRSDRVDIDPAVDAGGGFHVGWAAAGEWLNYTVEVGTAGNYLLEVRYASKGTGSTLHLEAKGLNVTGSIAVPDTGGWQTWRTLTRQITLTSGRQSLRLVFDKVGVNGAAANVNWFRLSPAGATSRPFLSTGPVILPGTVQFEAFDAGGESVAYHDTTHGNTGGAYRSTNADISSTTDTGGGYMVGWTRAGEWLNYTVNVGTARTYTLSARVSSNGTGGTFHVEFGGVDKTGPIAVPSTGGWNTFKTITKSVNLSTGLQIMRVVMDANGPTTGVANFNYVAVQ